MTLSTWTVTASVTPTAIATFLSHYTDRSAVAGTPSSDLSYHSGVQLVRRFLAYASENPVEDIQKFTAQYVPHPAWVHTEDCTIPAEAIEKAAACINEELGEDGVEKVGGRRWWKWRIRDLSAEWVEMRGDYWWRCKHPEERKRVMFYVHGGAYFFGSVDEHRYQVQRHARKLQARVFAPRYRLAPQFPFPCGLHDVLASYLHLLTLVPASSIIVAGDSAGGGMILSLLVLLRNQSLPLPAGGVLISPWVDLTHSFPSVIAPNDRDIIPAHGFLHKPSAAWPPPTPQDLEAMKSGEALKSPPTMRERATSRASRKSHKSSKSVKEAALGYTEKTEQGTEEGADGAVPALNTSAIVDNELVHIHDQIQMYTPNTLLAHPLVSPVLQSSLGNLPPLLIVTGGGEVLRDEQCYIAHKAANPAAYPTWSGHIAADASGRQKEYAQKYTTPTKVVFQVYEDCCHVVTTLSFTRPAKMMFKAIAEWGAWALAEAAAPAVSKNAAPVEPLDIPSSDSLSSLESELEDAPETVKEKDNIAVHDAPVAPTFVDSMSRVLISLNGSITPLPAASEMPELQLSPDRIGVIQEGPVKRWMEAKEVWDKKFAVAKRKVQVERAKEMADGGVEKELERKMLGEESLVGERPPPSALVGRRRDGEGVKLKGPSWGLMMWGRWGGAADRKKEGGKEKSD